VRDTGTDDRAGFAQLVSILPGLARRVSEAAKDVAFQCQGDEGINHMRKIRMAEHISLDGVIQPGGPNEDSDYAHGGWTAPYRTAAGAEAVAQAYGEEFDLLLGRRTYDLWAGFWPKVKGGPFADRLNAATKYVATHRPDSLGWGPVGLLNTYRRVESART
jgi:hypothetical protein